MWKLKPNGAENGISTSAPKVHSETQLHSLSLGVPVDPLFLPHHRGSRRFVYIKCANCMHLGCSYTACSHAEPGRRSVLLPCLQLNPGSFFLCYIVYIKNILCQICPQSPMDGAASHSVFESAAPAYMHTKLILNMCSNWKMHCIHDLCLHIIYILIIFII